MFPPAFTIQGPVGLEMVVGCTGQSGYLGVTCQPATWGVDIDIVVTNNMPNSTIGYVNVLFDWNQDGLWSGIASCATAGAPEHVLVDFPVPNGYSGPLSVLVPPAFLIGPNSGFVWARFTVSEQPVNTTDWDGSGIFEDGETEDYLLAIATQEEVDWGDAPDPTYPTLLANGGASHIIVSSVFLGASVDGDPDGQPNATATGDDVLDGNADEDGVVFTSTIAAGMPATLLVTASVAGMLDAWIDYNADGDWFDANEQIFVSQNLVAGPNSLGFNVPVGVTLGASFARFRFSTNGGLLSYGGAPDGEVEDYSVEILVPVELSSFKAQSKTDFVSLEWITQSESENLGFYLERSEYADKFYTRITPKMIKGAGYSQSEKVYTFEDHNIEPGKTYYYKLTDVSYAGVMTSHGPVSVTVTEPTGYELDQNYPNPFNPETTISFSAGESGFGELKIYNLQGQLVRELINKHLDPGHYSVVWNGHDDNGKLLPSGVYLYTLEINGFKQTKKMNFIK
ncbi:T9SS type A sorting domain-containing protein [candidate division KSB1 bacterium]|nr:T9SS type A sorting domain-containing protein [candidate division KSB1 bacterium]